jgi:hypothetical protein
VLRPASRALASAIVGLTLACTGDATTSPVQPSTWGSDQASLTVANGESRLLIFNSGSCYGQYANIPQPLPSPNFDVAGTFTQITGVYPGEVHEPAQFTGTISGTQLTITVTVPSQQQVLGPFVLTQGVTSDKGQCFYP